MSAPVIRTASDRALLVESVNLATSMRWHRSIAAAGLPGVTELIPAAQTILVHFDPSRVSAPRLRQALLEVPLVDDEIAVGREVRIGVHYDGEDLAELSGLLGVSPDELVRRHLDSTWQVAFSGFAPGFGYLVGNDPFFEVPRRSSPRTRVPAGSVALAGHFTGVYPRESPGGWQLIGHTEAVMWDLGREPPALLAPGTAVRFELASESVTVGSALAAAPTEQALPGQTHHDEETKAGFEIVRPALQMLIQDLGRAGHAALGVAASGVADRAAMRAANRAVGNQTNAAVVELVGGGAQLRSHLDTVAAITGAELSISITGLDESVRTAKVGVPFAVVAGDLIELGAAQRGLRAVLAVRGGIVAPPALGSVATDTLAGVGPAALKAGDLVRIGESHQAPFCVEPSALVQERLPASGETVTLEITLGPRDDWFSAAALETLCTQEWLVTPRSDRVGIRLLGDTPLERVTEGELPSEGAVTGAIQVPPDGQPVLFLPDHPLTGGYPIIGAVVDRCLDLAGQLPPGCKVRFQIVKEG